MPDISVLSPEFIPFVEFSGDQRPSVIRGSNAVIRTVQGVARIENYPGSNDLGENYNVAAETITGTIAFSPASDEIVGTGTSFQADLRQGQMIQANNGEPISVSQVIDDTHFIASRPPTTTATGQAARYLYRIFEMNRQRGVLRRGNAVMEEKRDIILVGQGKLYLNGVDTGFTATQQPKRLQREANGTYTEYPIGWSAGPTTLPTADVDTNGTKLMQPGKYSHRFSWYNTANKGFSNSSLEALKQTAAPADIEIAAGGRIVLDFTATLSAMVFNDGDVTIATGNINVTGHGLVTGDSVRLRNDGGVLPTATGGGLTEFTVVYYVIRIDADNFKLARTAALAAVPTPIVYTSAAGGGDHQFYKAPANADGFVSWSSQFGTTDDNEKLFNQGPWLKSKAFPFSDLDADNKYYLEYLDEELGAIVSGDNDQPPECEWVTQFANQRFYVSVFGRYNNTNPLGGSPGNYVIMEKSSNAEAAPSDWRVSLDDEITGFALGVGRMFCLTPNTVPFVTPTGRSELARLIPTILDAPFTSRPFWTKGSTAPSNIIVIQGDVFVYTGQTLLRSPSNADTNVVPFEIGLPVKDLTKEWFSGHVFLADSGKNQLCVISSAVRKNADGYWESEILPLDLDRNQWQPVITLTSTTRDMIVSGAATVNNQLEFLAGGRVSGGAWTISTFRYDESAGAPVDWYIALSYTDRGQKRQSAKISAVQVTGKTTSANVQIHGADWSNDFSLDDLEAGTNALATIPIPDAAGPKIHFRQKRLVKNLRRWSVRYGDTWSGTGEVDRIDELLIDLDFHGIKQ